MEITRKIAIFLSIILSVTFLTFSPVLQSQFIQWDDDFHVTHNPAVRSLKLSNLSNIFTQTVNKIYIPLTTLSYAIEYHFFQLNPLIYHLTNLLLHLAITGLIFILLLEFKLSIKAACVASLIFSIHPMHVESVAWITERKDVLYGFFYLLSVLLYCRYLRLNKNILYGLSLGFGFLSMLAKPMALSLPFILFLCDWWLKDDRASQKIKSLIVNKIPYFLYIIPIAWITYSQHSRIPGEGIIPSGIIWIWSFTFYIFKFFMPTNLTPLYVLPEPIGLTNPVYLLSFSAFVLIVTSLIYFRRKKIYLFAWAFYILSVFFLLRFDGKVDLGIVTDRFMYLPSFGFCFLLGSIFDHIDNSSHRIQLTGRIITITILCTLSFLTFRQTLIWKDSLSFWNYVIKQNNKLPIAYNNRGTVHEKEGRKDLAITDFDRAVELDPHYLECLCNRAVLTYYYLGSFEDSQKYFKRIFSLDPKYSTAYEALGIIYIHEKEYSSAEKLLLKAFETNPQSFNPLKQLIHLYILRNNDSQAIELINRILQFNLSEEEKISFYTQLAALYYRNQQMDKSDAYIYKIFQKNGPQNFIRTAKTFDEMNLTGPALELLNGALKYYPKNPDIYLLYGEILLKDKKAAAALAVWEKGTEVAPSNAQLINKIKIIKSH